MIVDHSLSGRIFTRLDVPTQKIEVDFADVIGASITRYNLLDWRVVLDHFERQQHKALSSSPTTVRFMFGGNRIEMTQAQAEHFNDTIRRLLDGLTEISDLAEDANTDGKTMVWKNVGNSAFNNEPPLPRAGDETNEQIDKRVNEQLEQAGVALPKPPAALYEMSELVQPQTNLNGTSKDDLVEDICGIMTALRRAAEMIQKGMPHDRDYTHRNNGVQARDAYAERINILHDMKQQFEQLALAINTGQWGDQFANEPKRRIHADHIDNMNNPEGKI
jgi:hypothetical protein